MLGGPKTTPRAVAVEASRSLPSPSTIAVTGLAGYPVPVQVAEVGSGPLVVFLHGLVGLNDHWEEVVARISDKARCVLLELPLLDLRDDDCSIFGATELTIRFLEQHLGAKAAGGAVLVGNSFGGHVAAKIAIQRPDLVRGLVLAGSSGLIEASIVSDVQIRPSREWLERKIGELFFDRANMNPGDVDRAHGELSDRGRARAMVKLSRTARRNHLGDDLHKVTSPTLLIWGRQDVVTPPEAAEGFLNGIRGSRIVWFEKCGHAPMIEASEAFALAMREFLIELDAKRPLANLGGAPGR